MIYYKRFAVCLAMVSLLSALVSCGHSNGPQTWTVLVYLDGDNNLANAALADLDEMKAVGSSDLVNVIVQLDLPNATTKRYRVLKGSLKLIADLGELDMASPQTLTDFLSWAKTAWPANRTVLVLWDHGNGWDQGDGPSSPAPQVRKSIFIDQDNNSRFLANHKVKKAIQASGLRLDILGLDACTMATLETLYEFKDLAPVIVSSEELTADQGWDYASVLTELEANTGASAERLAGLIVNSYRSFYENSFYPAYPGQERYYTISAVSTRNVEAIAEAVDQLAVRLIGALENPATRSAAISSISHARNNVQNIDLYAQPFVYVDLADLDRLLEPAAFPVSADIGQLTTEAVIAEYHGSARPNAHGVSIVFFKLPEAKTYNTFDPNYRNYDPVTNTGNGGDFINRFRWDEFLETYYSFTGL